MRLDLYVNYPGTCEDAFRFYEQHLGGTLGPIARHGTVPNPNIPPEWANKVLHARIQIGNAVLMGADIPSAQAMRSAYVTLTVDSVSDAERIYNVLTDGGPVMWPIAGCSIALLVFVFERLISLPFGALRMTEQFLADEVLDISGPGTAIVMMSMSAIFGMRFLVLRRLRDTAATPLPAERGGVRGGVVKCRAGLIPDRKGRADA